MSVVCSAHGSAALYAKNGHSQYLHEGLSGNKVKWPPKIAEYWAVIGCNHWLFVAQDSKLSHAGYSHIQYY